MIVAQLVFYVNFLHSFACLLCMFFFGIWYSLSSARWAVLCLFCRLQAAWEQQSSYSSSNSSINTKSATYKILYVFFSSLCCWLAVVATSSSLALCVCLFSLVSVCCLLSIRINTLRCVCVCVCCAFFPQPFESAVVAVCWLDFFFLSLSLYLSRDSFVCEFVFICASICNMFSFFCRMPGLCMYGFVCLCAAACASVCVFLAAV